MVEKEGLKYHTKSQKLTPSEKEILHLISDEFLTIKQIQIRRECSLQAIYKHIKNIKKKGHLGSGLNMVEKIQPTIQPNDVRLHAQEFNIKILWQDSYYQKTINKNNIIFLEGNTIRLYKNSIEIYSGNSFIEKTSQAAEKKSLEYWKRFFVYLENYLKITILKPKSRNIKLVMQHFARGDSEICDNAIDNKKKIRIFAEEDGKLAFITDDSFGFREDETLHPITAKKDRESIDKQINDWRLNNPPTNSQLAQIQAETTLQSQKMINVLSGLPKTISALELQINSHIKLIQEYRKENISWRKNKVKEIRKELKEGHQKTLSDY